MRKMMKCMMGALFVVGCLVGVGNQGIKAKAANWYDDYQYSLENDKMVLENYKGKAEDLTVPGRVTVDGKPYSVTAVAGAWNEDAKNLKSIQFGEGFVAPEDCSGMFWEMKNLETLDVSKWDTSHVTNTKYMFASCFALKNLDVSNFDMSNVVDMNGMFFECKSLAKIPVENWNVTKVEDMSFLFYKCEMVKKLDLHLWNTQSVKNLSDMFGRCYNVQSINLKGWNTSKVTSIAGLCSCDDSLESIDMSTCDLSKCKRDKEEDVAIFLRCGSLKTLKTPKKINYSIPIDNELQYKAGSKTYTTIPKTKKSLTLVCKSKQSKTPQFKGVTSKKGKVNVAWTKISGSDVYPIQYELQCSTSKNFTDKAGKFSNYITVDTEKKSKHFTYATQYGVVVKNNTVISGLEKGKAYYIRVRSIGFDTRISKWSKVKKITVK